MIDQIDTVTELMETEHTDIMDLIYEDKEVYRASAKVDVILRA